ncbi:MAG: MFS transporter [Candidatus Binatia bacterium]
MADQISNSANERAFYYGWYIVGVGFLSHFACAFFLSSTLSVFLKPLTADLGVSRGVFSLLRSGEYLIVASMAPLVGSLLDRHGGRWLMAIGALVSGTGFLLLSQVEEFWQFVLLRWTLITVGSAFMCHLVINVSISRWFVRRRGRAIAIANLGQGISKVSIPLVAASLFVWLGWRGTWGVFGIVSLVLVVGPAIAFMRRRPEDMGLNPDGAPSPYTGSIGLGKETKIPATEGPALAADMVWSRREALRTRAFWLIASIFSIADVGVTGLNLHVFAYVTDIGHPAIVAATVMSVIAFTQLASTLLWGLLSERVDVRKATMAKFLIQASGLSVAIAAKRLTSIYTGFFLYGIGLGGTQVLQEVIWANYFGRLSLGTVRGLSFPVTLVFAAVGPPFFGFLFDAMKSYTISFVLFVAALMVSAFLTLLVRPPKKQEVEGVRSIDFYLQL